MWKLYHDMLLVITAHAKEQQEGLLEAHLTRALKEVAIIMDWSGPDSDRGTGHG